jgi:2-polyprenyl-3-methyl-5-hydroxy-6-metoxy-1,4-benzoquinol methylase
LPNSKYINEYNLYDADKSMFEDVFSAEDPWHLGSAQEQYRYHIAINYIKKNFQKPGMKVLELGCAEGNFTEFLAREGYNITSVDISETAITRAKKKNIEGVEYVNSEMTEYINENDIKKFDLILLMECLYYLGKERRRILLELIHRNMNSEARIIISLPVCKRDDMFISEARAIKLMTRKGFGLFKHHKGIILTLRGKSGKLLERIPTYALKKIFIYIHKILFPIRINQKLFMFRKD